MKIVRDTCQIRPCRNETYEPYNSDYLAVSWQSILTDCFYELKQRFQEITLNPHDTNQDGKHVFLQTKLMSI